jgi:hypothetical protein
MQHTWVHRCLQTAGTALAPLLFATSAMAFIDFSTLNWQINGQPLSTPGNIFPVVQSTIIPSGSGSSTDLLAFFVSTSGAQQGTDVITATIPSGVTNQTINGSWGSTLNISTGGTLTANVGTSGTPIPNNMFASPATPFSGNGVPNGPFNNPTTVNAGDVITLTFTGHALKASSFSGSFFTLTLTSP